MHHFYGQLNGKSKDLTDPETVLSTTLERGGGGGGCCMKEDTTSKI
jgi:hypothetical protein